MKNTVQQGTYQETNSAKCSHPSTIFVLQQQAHGYIQTSANQ